MAASFLLIVSFPDRFAPSHCQSSLFLSCRLAVSAGGVVAMGKFLSGKMFKFCLLTFVLMAYTALHNHK